MPQPTFLAAIGFTKDNANSTLSAAVAAGATVIPITSTNIPASSTIIIIDGANTEVRAVTAGGGTNSLTVAALTNAHSANMYVFSQLTAAYGPTDWMPITTFNRHAAIMQLPDRALRGSAVEAYGSSAGVRSGTFTIAGPVFTDVFPYLIGGVTGATDFTGGTPNQHAFSVKNTGDSQPTPLALWVRTAIDTRIFVGARVSKLLINFDTSQLLAYSADIVTWMGGPVTAAPAPSYSAITPVPSWQCQATIAGTAVLFVRKSSVTVERTAQPIFTLQGIPDPYKVFAGPQKADIMLDAVMEDNGEFNRYLLTTQPVLDLKYTAAGANPITLTVHATKANYDDIVLTDTGQDYISLVATATCLANTTDATTAGTGQAPVKITATSTKATGYYL